ncbi:MAG: hypothetical protein Q9212_002184 [Teloschistes hypoglaucus]
MLLPCGNPKCPLLHLRHHEGVYRDEGSRPVQDSAPLGFGLSNPPPEIWQARERINAGIGQPSDYQMVHGFIAAHGIEYMEPGPPPGLTLMDVAREETAEREEEARRETAEREEQARREAAERAEQARREMEEKYEQALRRLRDIGINDPSEEQGEWPHDEIVTGLLYEIACLETEDVDMARMTLNGGAADADQQGASGQAPPADAEDLVATEDPAAGENSAAGESSAAGEEPAAGEDADMEDV